MEVVEATNGDEAAILEARLDIAAAASFVPLRVTMQFGWELPEGNAFLKKSCNAGFIGHVLNEMIVA